MYEVTDSPTHAHRRSTLTHADELVTRLAVLALLLIPPIFVAIHQLTGAHSTHVWICSYYENHHCWQHAWWDPTTSLPFHARAPR